MKKIKISELDKESLDRIITMAQEEKRPIEAVRNEFGFGEKELSEIMKKHLSFDNYELWKKKIQTKKPKPKMVYDEFEDDLDSKYYIKNKFD